MIDTHCHLLWRIDDGPHSAMEAMDLARVLVAQGVRAALCTPHYSPRFPTRHSVVRDRFEELRRDLDELDVPLQTELAAEVYFKLALSVSLEELQARAIGGFLVVELEAEAPADAPAEVFYRLAGAGLDVTDPEPPAPDDPILHTPGIFVTPHLGSATTDTRTARADLAARNVIAVLAGEPPLTPQELPKALETRTGYAESLLALDAKVAEIVGKLKEKGLQSPYLRNFVVARLNPLRFKRGETMPIEDTLRAMSTAAAKFNVDKINAGDLARSGLAGGGGEESAE